ncbi:hypothetical protein BCV70DRAFT_199018 [Testicularia cyperi]|uniref:Glutathione hydrolase n=1 Tax=Testicularia cyperi TaxID=1882483 RepID=A0A317XTC1_9BASI|nr:hypothetical protein BCV70DRAFT_199018 [Testicularia cyperi]
MPASAGTNRQSGADSGLGLLTPINEFGSQQHHATDAQETTPLLPSNPSSRRSSASKPGSASGRSAQSAISNSILILVGVFTIAVTVSIVLKQVLGEFADPHDPPYSTDPRGRRHPAVLAQGRKAGVATENPTCSQIGIDILKQKGSAVDAAIASTLCVGVTNMFSSGIGGGGFMIVRDPTPCFASGRKPIKGGKDQTCVEHITIDFRETAPSAANKTMYLGQLVKAQIGGLAVAVPGELRGLEEAHRRFGRLEWSRLVQPSVQIAREFAVSKELDRRLDYFGQFMKLDPVWSEIFVDPATGELKKQGDLVRRTAYAETLQTISTKGPRAFYEGPIAKSIVETVQKTGGVLTLNDMAGYKAEVKPAIEGRWQGNKVWTTQAPTSGPVLLSVLNILSGFPDFVSNGPTGLNIHRFVEALKFGFGQRTELADPAFMKGEDLDRMSEIPTLDEADRLRPNLTDDRTHPLDYYHPKFDILDDHGTMHLSIVDQDGMAVALTSTVNLIFGSRVMDPNTGVILNDEMDDSSTPGVPNAFGLAPSPFNYPEPGKRPLSSTCPAILETADGEFLMAVGGSGGSRIFSSVLQTIFNHLDWGMDLSTAIESPRVHHQLLPTALSVETTYPDKILTALKGRNHDISFIDIDLGIAEVQAVSQQTNGKLKKIFAASDSRKGGIAMAY